MRIEKNRWIIFLVKNKISFASLKELQTDDINIYIYIIYIYTHTVTSSLCMLVSVKIRKEKNKTALHKIIKVFYNVISMVYGCAALKKKNYY